MRSPVVRKKQTAGRGTEVRAIVHPRGLGALDSDAIADWPRRQHDVNEGAGMTYDVRAVASGDPEITPPPEVQAYYAGFPEESRDRKSVV